jgi:hypothetical protein
MRCKVLVCAVISITLVIFPGCNKKNKFADMKKSPAMPEMTKKSTTDTGDIFKEFYSDDTTGQGISKKASSKPGSKNHTFSPASATPVSAPPSAAVSGEFLENGKYVVQVSCVQSKSFAEKMVRTLKEKNFPAYSAEVQNPTPALSGTFHRVRIGCFGGYGSAKAFGNNTLVPAGYEFWVDKKANDNTGLEGYGLGGGAPATASPALNSSSPTSSWSASAPSNFPAAESPSSNPFGQPDFSTSSSVSAPAPVNSAPSAAPANVSAKKESATPQAVPPAAASSAKPVATSSSTTAPQPAPTTKSAPLSSPSSGTSSGTNSGTSIAPAKEAGDWGSDSVASSGW